MMVSLIFSHITCVAPLLIQNLPCPWRTFTPDVHVTPIQLMTHTMKVRSVLSAITTSSPNKHPYNVIFMFIALLHYCCLGAVCVGLCISLCLIISVTTIVAILVVLVVLQALLSACFVCCKLNVSYIHISSMLVWEGVLLRQVLLMLFTLG